MTTIRVMRKNLDTENEKIVSGYGHIPISLAIQFLDHETEQEANRSKLLIRKDNVEDGERIIHRRFLVEDHGGRAKDVVMYYLKFINDESDNGE